ncbi:MAG TPA: hypothetical protein VE642_06185, partial [Pyrinomonadaceae bacterium]|nr:hypothetical protein [Pyrinomonadaceae bacterium]
MKTRHMAYALAAALVLAAPALLPSLTVWRSAVAHASATPQSPGGRDESAKGGVCPEKCYAVLVGVEKYDSPKIAPYEGGGYDSFGLYLSLRKAGFDAEHISLLNDMSAYHAPPTRENILSALSRLRGKAPADGILFVSFGGHGVELGGRSYLLPSDAAASESPRLMEETAIRVDLLKALIRATGAGQVVIFLDTHRVEPLRGDGHEDHLLTESFRDSWKFDEAGGGVKAATLFASGVGQRSYSNYLRGFFSEGLAEGLDELPEESTNPLTLEALVSYVRKTVSARALAQTGKQQVPFAVVQGQQAGEFILAKPEYDTARVSNKLGGPAGVEHLGGAISGVGGNSNTAPGPPRNGNSNTAASGNSNAGVEQRGAVKLTDRETKNPIAPRGKVGRRPDRSGWSHGVEGLRALGQPSARFIVGPERAFIAEQHWETIRASNSPEDYRAFAELYPDSPYASAAKLRYRALRSAPAAQLERYANINCPEDAKVGKPIVVIAQLTMDRRAPLAEQLGQKGDDALAIKRDAGQTSWKIDVIVDAAGFTFLNGSNLYTVDLPADKDSGRARFDLQPKPIKGPSQKTRVYISFWYDGAYLGEVSREVTVTAPLKQGAVTDRKGVPLPLSRSVQTNQQPTPSGGGGGIGRLGTNGPLIRRGINSEAAHNNKNSSTSPMPPLPPSPGPSAAKTEDDTLGLDTNREGPDMTVVLRRVNPDQPGKYQVEIISPHYSASYLPEEYDVPADLSRLVKKYYLTVAASGRGVKPVRPSGQEGGAPPQGSDAMLRDLGREMFRRAPQTFK